MNANPPVAAPEMPLLLHPFPKAILHLDADAFFASVEQALRPELRGKPVVTGKERGIIACASYEAKAVGVKRGISLPDARKLCPSLIVLPSDYETYSLYSKRMFNIMRRFTPMVEENSVDEAYAEITGMRRLYRASYPQIARMIKQAVQSELGITVSVGLSVSKILAKLASKFRKPDGFTAVQGMHIHLFLKRIPVGDVCGIGPNSVSLLEKQGIRTAWDFAQANERLISRLLGKVGRELRQELRGNSVYPIVTEEKTVFATISKCKSFTVPSADRDYVYARLIRGMESAFIKLRRYNLKTGMIGVLLRHADFNEAGFEARLNRATFNANEAVPLVRYLFDRTYRPGVLYRATMIFLSKLEDAGSEQMDLFQDRLRIDAMTAMSRTIDAVNEKFGKHTLALGTGLFLDRAVKNARDVPPARKQNLLSGETWRQHLNIPRMSVRV